MHLQELSFFTESIQQLKIAQVKFVESGDCIEKLTPETTGQDLLVPLTSCMYVPGKIADSENLLIDVGTGYYVEKVCKKSIEREHLKHLFMVCRIVKGPKITLIEK